MSTPCKIHNNEKKVFYAKFCENYLNEKCEIDMFTVILYKATNEQTSVT